MPRVSCGLSAEVRASHLSNDLMGIDDHARSLRRPVHNDDGKLAFTRPPDLACRVPEGGAVERDLIHKGIKTSVNRLHLRPYRYK